MENNHIKIENLNKFFGNEHILKNVNLDVKEGEFLSLIGRSGCGKTLFLRCLHCLDIPDSGIINISNISLDLSKVNANKKSYQLQKSHESKSIQKIRDNVGMLFQNLNLFPHLTVIENIIKAPMIVKKMGKDEAIDKAQSLLDKVGMKGYDKRYPYQLSGGQAQRVAIARALAMSPRVMLYDEPTSALDPELANEVFQVMKNLHTEGMTQIVVTHSLNYAQKYSDRIAFMDHGNIVEVSRPDILFSRPKDIRTDRFLRIYKD